MTSEQSTPTADLSPVATLTVVRLVAFMPKVGPLHTLQHRDASSGFLPIHARARLVPAGFTALILFQ
jgi:hypothetical protein